MLANHHSKLLHLNRNLGLAVLGMVAIQLVALGVLAPAAFSSSWQSFMAPVIVSVLYVAVVEGARYLLGYMHAYWQNNETDEETPMAIRLFGRALQSISLAFIVVTFALTHSVWVAALLPVPMVGAYFICRNKLAVSLGLTSVLAGLLVGMAYPLLGSSAALVASVPVLSGVAAGVVSMVLAIFPTLIWWQLGGYISSLVGSSSHQVNRLQSLATTDPLTGLMNRRLLMHQLQIELSRARRHDSPLCVALFDVDHFKRVNDVYGHQAGDRILKELGALIHHNVRDCDLGGRYGGEEFALILPETRQAEAAELMERIRATVERHVFCLPDNPMTITISVGLAQMDGASNQTKDDMIHLADAALYEAKQQGRNRVIYGVLPVPKVSYTKSYASY